MSIESLLRDKAELFRRVNRIPDKIWLAEREAGENLLEAFNELKYRYKSMEYIGTGWSDKIIRIDPNELLAEPVQQGLF